MSRRALDDAITLPPSLIVSPLIRAKSTGDALKVKTLRGVSIGLRSRLGIAPNAPRFERTLKLPKDRSFTPGFRAPAFFRLPLGRRQLALPIALSIAIADIWPGGRAPC